MLTAETAPIWAECLQEARRWLCQGCAEGWPWYDRPYTSLPHRHLDPDGNPRDCIALALRRAIAGRGGKHLRVRAS